MDVKTWTTVSRLLDDALDVPPGVRSAWLDGLDAEYDALKPRLRQLLAQAAWMDSAALLATLPKIATADDASAAEGGASEEGSRAGTAVGPYRLVRVLASGGQGSVWLAERADGLVNRSVALKLPHGLAFRPGLADRMARERDILATLNHPHIARLYDAGVTAEGEPYLALEYVDGTAIDRHCAERALSIPERVRLFLQVVRAVAYAHGQLVIHRDLKPSNILVTGEGYVRLLDFGIAKLLATDAPVDSTLTADAGRALTLPYASPEQVLQQPLGVTTDVYSLGVVLYELLAGVSPHRPERDSAAALEDAILHADVKRPSDIAATALARKAIAGDLDTIVLKALKRADSERYATADALADDLERALDGRPVLAQPDTRTYRARKFVRRHKGGVAATAASVTAVLAGLGLAVWQARVARVERDVAVQQQARSEAVGGFLDSLMQQAGADRPLTGVELLERGEVQLKTAQGISEPVLAFLWYEMSKHYLRLGQTDREVALLTRSADGAARAGDDDLLAAALCSQASALAARDVTTAATHLDMGERAFARVAIPSLNARADCVRGRARVLTSEGRVDEAIHAIESALPSFPPRRQNVWARHGMLHMVLTDLYSRAGRPKDALVLAEETLDNMRFKGQGGTVNEFTALTYVASVLSDLGEVSAARAIYRDLVSWQDRGGFSPNPFPTLVNASAVELRTGNIGAALGGAMAARHGAEEAGNPRTAATAGLLVSRALLALGRIVEARQTLDVSVAQLRTNPAGNRQLLEQAELVGSEVAAAVGQVREALAAIERVLGSVGYPERRSSPILARALRLAARYRITLGDPLLAEVNATVAFDLARRIARDERKSADVGEAALLRAQAHQALDRHADALADAQLAAAALGEGLGPDNTLTAQAKALVEALTAQALAPR